MQTRLWRVINRCLGAVVKQVTGGTITRVQTSEPVAALTFDDGPDPGGTPHLLELFEKHGAKATFFMVGAAAVNHRGIVEQVSRAGHAIDNHTWDHASLPMVSRRERVRQLRDCAQALKGYETRLFRPPYGHQSCASQFDAWRYGYQVVTWDVVLVDWLDHDPESLAQRAVAKIRPGSIVLLHDGLFDFMEERYRNRGKTVETVERILVELGSRYRFVTVPELMRCGKPARLNWFMKPDWELLNGLKRCSGQPRRYQALRRVPWLGFNR